MVSVTVKAKGMTRKPFTLVDRVVSHGVKVSSETTLCALESDSYVSGQQMVGGGFSLWAWGSQVSLRRAEGIEAGDNSMNSCFT